MAGRCGCGGACSCVVEGIPPVRVTGNGSVQRSYKVGLEGPNGESGCNAVAACVGQNLGPGLRYDKASGKLAVKLSRDDGNTITFGTDQGIKDLGGGTPSPATCTRGLSALPPAPEVVGASDLAGLHNPYSSPAGVEYCLAAGVDIIGFHVATSSDDVGVVADFWDHIITSGRTSLYVSQDIRQINSSTVKTVWNYAGDVDDPVAYQPSSNTDRAHKGGWYGWLAPRYYQPLAGEFLDRIGGRAVALMDVSVDPKNATYSEATALIGAIRAALGACAQDWAMIGVRELANAETVIGAGFTPVMMPLKPSKWGETALPYPVADLTAAGVEWIVLHSLFADSVFTAYKDAGFQVLLRGGSRHHERTRAASLGIRGAYQLDPVYYRGGVAGASSYGYRTEYDPWEHRRPGTGQLTFMTDQQAIGSSTGHVRGRAEAAEQGLILPENFGNGVGRAAVLVGWECPMQSATDYSVTWDMKWLTLAKDSAARAKMGMLFGAATDDEPYAWPVDPALNPLGFPEGQKTMYRVWQRQNGEIGIGKWDSPTASLTTLASKATPAIATGVWNSYELVVTPVQITFSRVMSDGTRHTITAADSQYRGGYFWVEKEESFTGSPANPFEGKFRNLTYRAVGDTSGAEPPGE